MFLPFPSLGEGGGCKKILREIFSFGAACYWGQGTVLQSYLQICLTLFSNFEFLSYGSITVLHMFGVDNVRHMFGIPLPKNVCGRKRSNIRLLSRILIFLIKHIVFPQFGVPNNIVDLR